MATKQYSVVVPIYNEAENISLLHQEIVTALNTLGGSYEIIFVDDGSSDATPEIIAQLRPVRYMRLARNYGQTAALDAGFKAASGEIVITLDGDGQNPPAEIPKLLTELRRGSYDVVSGWRYRRKDVFMKRFVSRTAHVMRSWLIHDGIHDSGCSLKAYQRSALMGLDLYGENHRFIPAILKVQGYRIGEVKVEHRPRTHGVSKYNWKRGVKGMVDMIGLWFWRKYASRPLHVFGGGGLFFGSLGFAMLMVMFVLRFFNLISLSEKIWPLIAVFLMLVGVQLFVAGIMADIAVKNYFAANHRTYYRIKTIREQ